MIITVAIPTYWGRRRDDPRREGDVLYYHPTPIDGESLLPRMLESLKILENKKFKLVIPVCTTCGDIEEEAEERVAGIIRDANLDISVFMLTHRNMREIRGALKARGVSDRSNSLLGMSGYPNVLNACLYAGAVLSDDVTILLDECEVIEDPHWIDKATEYIGKRVYGRGIYGVAGYYINKYGEYSDEVDIMPWMTYFNRFASKTKAFDKMISCDPRLKITTFAQRGAMVIHRNLSSTVPFDPDTVGGEDLDYLINAKMFGFNFFLDNTLSIKRMTPRESQPTWKKLREDIYTYVYEQAKIRSQYEVNNMVPVSAEEFDPYPGEFLKEDIKDKIYKTSILLALEYLSEGDVDGCKESIRNVYLSEHDAIPQKDTFTEFRRRQKDWSELMSITVDLKTDLRKILETNNQRRARFMVDRQKYENVPSNIIIENLKRFRDFNSFSDEELEVLASYFSFRAFDENAVIFQKGASDLEMSLVVSGSVRIVEYADDGEEILLAVIDPGAVLGETLMIKSTYEISAIANDFVEVLTVRRESIEDLIVSHPSTGNKLLYIFMNEIYRKLNLSNEMYKEVLQRSHGVEMR